MQLQSYTNWCITIVDDVSTDKSTEIIKKYNAPNIEYFLSDVKVFGGGARNIGINKTKYLSEYTLFLDSDDYFETEDCL